MRICGTNANVFFAGDYWDVWGRPECIELACARGANAVNWRLDQNRCSVLNCDGDLELEDGQTAEVFSNM